MKRLSSSKEIADLCQYIDHTCQTLEAPYIALDTEFLREKTYWPQLCLIQVGFQNDVWILDPLEQSADLAPFFDLLQNQKIMKVFHAARQDLEIFYHLTGALPVPLFDTQIAAMVCGYQDSVGYDTLVNDFLGVQLDKSSRRTDWSKRPLSDTQLSYAADDVRYLVKVYDQVQERLASLRRGAWIEEEMAPLTKASTYETLPEDAYKRLKIKRNTPRYLEALRRLAAWREHEAQTHDLARPFVVKDEVLQDLALLNPKTEKEAFTLASLKNRPPSRQRLKTLLDLLEKARETPVSKCPLPLASSPKKADRQMMSFLKLLLSEVSEKNKVAEKLLATSKELEAFALNPDDEAHPLQKGWRGEIFGQRAKALLEGQLSASLKDQKLVFEKA